MRKKPQGWGRPLGLSGISKLMKNRPISLVESREVCGGRKERVDCGFGGGERPWLGKKSLRTTDEGKYEEVLVEETPECDWKVIAGDGEKKGASPGKKIKKNPSQDEKKKGLLAFESTQRPCQRGDWPQVILLAPVALQSA